MSLKNRARVVLKGEEGGPSVETIILIAVAMLVGVALIAFGRQIVDKINQANENVNTLATNSNLA